MTLRQLEILRALIRHRTTVSAARDLGLTQPAVSNALRAMEQQFGFALFHRVNNRLFPTDEALTLHEDGEAIFALHARLQGRVQEMQRGTGGRLSIVATPPLAYSLVPSALRRFLEVRPGTSVFLDVRRYEGVTEAVLTRVADLGFALGFSHQPGIGHRVIHTGEMVCALPPGHQLARLEQLTPRDLVGTPMIGLERGTRLGETVRASFAQQQVPYVPTVEVRYCNTACVLAAAGVGVAVVDPFSPHQGVGSLELRRFAPSTPAVAYALWSEAQPLSRIGEVFMKFLVEEAEARSASATPEAGPARAPISRRRLPGS